eukprot:3416610-Pyramimonas_sp.AAC.1
MGSRGETDEKVIWDDGGRTNYLDTLSQETRLFAGERRRFGKMDAPRFRGRRLLPMTTFGTHPPQL